MDSIKNIFIKKILSYYEVGEVISVGYLGGFTAKNYIVKTESGNYVLKIYSFNQVKFAKHSTILSDLAAKSGLPVPSPIKNKKGSKLTFDDASGIGTILMPFLAGDILHNNQIGSLHYQSVAFLAARFQKVLSNFSLKLINQQEFLKLNISNFDIRKSQFMSKMHTANIHRKRKDLILSCISIKEQVISITKSTLENSTDNFCTVVHGDFHNENVIFQKDKAKWIIDLDEVRFGWAGEDVVTFALFTCGESDLSLSVIRHAEPLFKSFIKYSKVSKEEMELSINATFLRLAISFRLEEWALYDKSELTLKLLNRDLKKYRSFLSNYNSIHEVWACR